MAVGTISHSHLRARPYSPEFTARMENPREESKNGKTIGSSYCQVFLEVNARRSAHHGVRIHESPRTGTVPARRDAPAMLTLLNIAVLLKNRLAASAGEFYELFQLFRLAGIAQSHDMHPYFRIVFVGSADDFQ